MTVSQRGNNAPISPIRSLTPFANAAKQKGIHIYHLNIGDPDFTLPDLIQKSLRTFAQKTTRPPYPQDRGKKNLLEAWTKYYKDIKIHYEITREEMMVNGEASEGMVETTI